MKKKHAYDPPLTIREMTLSPGKEWKLKPTGWSIIQVQSGTGYWLQQKGNHGLEAGMVLLLAPELPGNFRASQLDGMTLAFFRVEPENLIGLCSFADQLALDAAKSNAESELRILPAGSPVSEKMKLVSSQKTQGDAPLRLRLLQIFFEGLGNDFKHPASSQPALDARGRLQEFLKKTPQSELISLSITELARLTRCTPRHLSRIFQEVVGVSFRDKYNQLRLARARELLATTEFKVLDVALESGYQSLSLFNLMFTRRFGVSPGRWRQTFGECHGKLRPKQRRISLPTSRPEPRAEMVG